MLLRWISGVDVCATATHRDSSAAVCHCHPRGNRHPCGDTYPAPALAGKRHHSAFDSDSIYPGYENVYALTHFYLDRLVHT
jgi:hypothetical protein